MHLPDTLDSHVAEATLSLGRKPESTLEYKLACRLLSESLCACDEILGVIDTSSALLSGEKATAGKKRARPGSSRPDDGRIRYFSPDAYDEQPSPKRQPQQKHDRPCNSTTVTEFSDDESRGERTRAEVCSPDSPRSSSVRS